MTTIRPADFGVDIPNLLSVGGNVSIAVAYVSQDGVASIRQQLQGLLENNHSARVLVDLQSGNTDPSAVWTLVELQEQFKNLSLRTIVPSGTNGPLHAKLYINLRDDELESIVGSANLTGAALNRNLEYGIAIASPPDSKESTMLLEAFDSMWHSPQAQTIDHEAARLYELYSGRLRTSWLSGERRARGAWGVLRNHLHTGGRGKFEWPSVEGAYLMGAIAARGKLVATSSVIEINLLFRPASYSDGRIRVRNKSFAAARVLPTIPEDIAAHARRILPNAKIGFSEKTVSIDLSDDKDAFSLIQEAFAPHTDCDSFRLPKRLSTLDESTVAAFARGFSVASALLTEHTSMPRNARTGLPGQMVVWLRPKQSNVKLFNEMYDLLTRRLGLVVYKHERFDRDPHLKVLCENFEEKVGFGIGWWDELVREGSSYNFAQFPQLSFGSN